MDQNGVVTSAAQVQLDTDVTVTATAQDGSELSASIVIRVTNNHFDLPNKNVNIINASNTACYFNGWPSTMESPIYKNLLACSKNDLSAEQMFTFYPVDNGFNTFVIQAMEYGGKYCAASASECRMVARASATVFKLEKTGNYFYIKTTDGTKALTLGGNIDPNYPHQFYLTLSSFTGSNKQKWSIVERSASLVTTPASVTVAKGGSQTLTAVIKSDTTGNEPPLLFKSADTSIATVTSKGVVKGISGGKTTITVSTPSNIKKSVAVTVTELSGVPVVEFAKTAVSNAENCNLSLDVKTTNWTTSNPLKVSLALSDGTLEIVNTILSSATQTLADLGRKGTIYGNGRSISHKLPTSKNRTFYIQKNAATTKLYIAGHYTEAVEAAGQKITLTLKAPADGTYTVGANSTCTITFTDVNAKKPTSRGTMTKAQWVAKCLPWLEQKYPSGRYWNHMVGTHNNDNMVTKQRCTTKTHGLSDGLIYNTSWVNRGVNVGDTICLNNDSNSESQCAGFAMKVAADVFGSCPGKGSKWKYIENPSYKSLQAGDYVRIPGHSFFVTRVDGNKIYTLECNNGPDFPCVIFRPPFNGMGVKTVDWLSKNRPEFVYRYSW